jgi:hypothetical protein
MAHNRLVDQKLLNLLACGATKESAARQAGVSVRTVHRRMADPEFCSELQALRADMVQRTAGALTAAGTAAVQTMLELMKAPASGPVRLGAARAVLELGLKVREMAEFEERLAVLEQQLAQKTPVSRGRAG